MSDFEHSTGISLAPWHEALQGSKQLIVVVPDKKNVPAAALYACARNMAGWVPGFFTEAVIGKAGYIAPEKKQEGDMKTPLGLYSIDEAFAYNEFPETQMPLRVSGPADLWVDDPAHPDYNKWVKAPTTAQSYELMLRNDHQYEYGLVVGYNRQPVHPGKGSAVFFHVWENPQTGTAACIAMARDAMRQLLRWLKPYHSPRALITLRH